MTDANVTMMVGATVASLIAIRKGQHRFPLCVTIREITECRPELKRDDVIEVLKDNYSSTAALPIFSAESQLHKTVRDAVHRTFREMLQAHPEMREWAEKDGIPKEMIDKILSEGEAPSAEEVNFDSIK